MAQGTRMGTDIDLFIKMYDINIDDRICSL